MADAEVTLQANFKSKEMTVNTNSGEQQVKLNLWDTAGMEKFNSINRFYFRETHAAIIVYDITKEESFSRVQFWGNELDQYK